MPALAAVSFLSCMPQCLSCSVHSYSSLDGQKCMLASFCEIASRGNVFNIYKDFVLMFCIFSENAPFNTSSCTSGSTKTRGRRFSGTGLVPISRAEPSGTPRPQFYCAGPNMSRRPPRIYHAQMDRFPPNPIDWISWNHSRGPEQKAGQGAGPEKRSGPPVLQAVRRGREEIRKK